MQAEGRHPRRADRAPALPRGPVQGAALPVRALPRHRPRRLVPGQRPLGGARGPERAGKPAAAVPALRAATRTTAGRELRARPRSTCRTTRTTSRRSSRSTPTRPPETYGQITVLHLLDEQQPGPGQDRQRDAVRPAVSAKLLPFKPERRHPVTYGNLLTLPVSGGLMYVEPVYASSAAVRRQLPDPALRRWSPTATRSASASTLEEALDQRPRRRDGDDAAADDTGNPPPNDGGGGTGNISAQVRTLLADAQADVRGRRPRVRGRQRRPVGDPHRGGHAEGRPGHQAPQRAEPGSARRRRQPGTSPPADDPDLGGLLPCRNLAFTDAGWSSSVARWAHNPEVAGSNPAPATK